MDLQITSSCVTWWTDIFQLHWTAQMFLCSGSQVNTWHMELPSCLSQRRPKAQSRHLGLVCKSGVAEPNQKILSAVTAPSHPWKYFLCFFICTVREESRDKSWTTEPQYLLLSQSLWSESHLHEDLKGQMSTAMLKAFEKPILWHKDAYSCFLPIYHLETVPQPVEHWG